MWRSFGLLGENQLYFANYENCGVNEYISATIVGSRSVLIFIVEPIDIYIFSVERKQFETEANICCLILLTTWTLIGKLYRRTIITWAQQKSNFRSLLVFYGRTIESIDEIIYTL